MYLVHALRDLSPTTANSTVRGESEHHGGMGWSRKAHQDILITKWGGGRSEDTLLTVQTMNTKGMPPLTDFFLEYIPAYIYKPINLY